jgi:KaiC/GvpD/RAD55 family RecA-like ATPase
LLPEFPANLSAAPTIVDKTITSGNSWIANALDGLKEGNRDTTFARVVGRLHHSGLDPITIRALLSPYADHCTFTGLDKVIKSVTRYNRAVNTLQVESGGESIEEFMQESEPVEWIVPDLIAKSSVGFVAGLPETLKTWLLLDLAVEVARGGGKWLGLFGCTAGRVLFIDQERFKGETQRRFKKLISAKGLTASSLRDSLYVSCGTTTRLNLDESFRAFRSKLLELRPDLVIIDSFATFHTEDENDRRSIQKVIERIKELREETGSTFIFIDHETKSVFTDKENKESPSAFRMVGSVGKSAAAEFVFTVRRYDPSTSTVYHTKSTLCPTIPCFNATVKDVQDGIIVRGKVE